MKNNGFTLVELLGVIVILGIILAITTITVTGILNNSSSKLTNIQVEKLKDAAKNYYIAEGMTDLDYEQTSFSHCVNVEYLLENGYIDSNEVSNFETYEEMLGSVRIHYNGKKYNYSYVEDSCKICSIVSGQSNTIGSKYQCKVKDNMETGFEDGYYFFVLSHNNDGSTNLIMDRNINSDGTPVEKAILNSEASENNGIYNLVAWVSKSDYNDDTNYGENGNNNKGPITAMNFLYDATKDWTNIPNIELDYKDGYGTIKTENGLTQIIKKDENIETGTYENLKTRMPYKSEVNNYDSTNKTNTYLYDYFELYNNIQTNSISGIYGYWLLSSYTDNSYGAWILACNGSVAGSYVSADDGAGIRPVITIPNQALESGNW